MIQLLRIISVWAFNLIFGQTSYDSDYNRKIGQWLDEEKELKVGKHKSTLNGLLIWTANYPFAFGYPYEHCVDLDNGKEFGLSARNIVRLKIRIEQANALTESNQRAIKKDQLLKKLGGEK